MIILNYDDFKLAYRSFIPTHSLTGKDTIMLCAAALSIRRARQDEDSSLPNALMIKENPSGIHEPTCKLGYIPCYPTPDDGTVYGSGETLYHLGPGKYFCFTIHAWK